MCKHVPLSWWFFQRPSAAGLAHAVCRLPQPQEGFSGTVNLKDAAHEDGYLQVVTGPWQGYELSVTRALGHKHMSEHGVLTEPYVVTFEASKDDCCLVGLGHGRMLMV